MGRLTDKPFTESCCDGGECGLNDQSCQSCGCDKGANWLCERHFMEGMTQAMSQNDEQPNENAVPVEVLAISGQQGMDLLSTTVGAVVGQVGKDAKWRKQRPLWSGVMNYFPDALLEVAFVSWVGNEQHNPGQHLHWDRSKSTDEADACARHLMESGKFDTDGTRHSAKAAWRALALLQKEIEAESGK